MVRTLKQTLWVGLASLIALSTVSDVHAVWPFRRRGYDNTYYYAYPGTYGRSYVYPGSTYYYSPGYRPYGFTPNYGSYGTYGSAPAAGVGVAAPAVGGNAVAPGFSPAAGVVAPGAQIATRPASPRLSVPLSGVTNGPNRFLTTPRGNAGLAAPGSTGATGAATIGGNAIPGAGNARPGTTGTSDNLPPRGAAPPAAAPDSSAPAP